MAPRKSPRDIKASLRNLSMQPISQWASHLLPGFTLLYFSPYLSSQRPFGFFAVTGALAASSPDLPYATYGREICKNPWQTTSTRIGDVGIASMDLSSKLSV
ncbi:hypothetical protein PHLCEN_2v5416 [Hermanssonia centrifuga]|uniref:Uncharacterized protein n=1 Tax=Hermanssonia centrifuga TaxID=98765 RepID=A0A2R6P5B0_9APHY|nr:hypothetical protein PHLCEN_2v5416 [Hermanssonia centrifuga]